MHIMGFSSLYFFKKNEQWKSYNLLRTGMLYYWLVCPVVILAITGSPSFVFFIYFEPAVAMTYFLAFINIGLHAYIDFDENGKHLWAVNSSAVIDGDDDYFGEDDHLAHHYSTNTYFKDLKTYRAKKMEDFKTMHASIFQKFSILEHSLFLLLKDWDKLAEHFVDVTGKLSKEEIISLLKARAVRKEMSYYEYEFKWLPALKKNHWMN
uniref:Fatty acid desaturase domain-containing protein n=1 Tax=Lotharella oceanica TaxID=641309 RepID=A0A7S2TY77_9EUKA